MNRRELSTRSQAWPSAIAGVLARAGVTPNQVSVASMAFAALSAWAYYAVGDRPARTPVFLAIAVAGIQLRLLCNLLDGLLAIEGGLKSKTGDLYNELPDRAADILILVAAGLALRPNPWGVGIGVGAAMLAVLTAYVRLLGGSLGFKQDFVGPMAKQHRMFVLTLGTLIAAVEFTQRQSVHALYVALWVIAVGSALTLLRRVHRIARALETR